MQIELNVEFIPLGASRNTNAPFLPCTGDVVCLSDPEHKFVVQPLRIFSVSFR